MLIVILIIILYVISGVFAFGGTLGYFQREYPESAVEDYWSDFLLACFLGLTGFSGFLVCWLKGGFEHGLKFH